MVDARNDSGEQRSPARRTKMVPVRKAERPSRDLLGWADYESPADEYAAGRAPTPSSASAASSLLSALLRRKWLILLVFLIVAASTIPLIWLYIPPKYRGLATIRIKPVLDPIVEKSERTGALPFYQSYVNTQVARIQTPVVLERVLDRPEIQEMSWYNADHTTLFGGRLRAIEVLYEMLDVSQARGTELINVAVFARKPGEAKDTANLIVDEYIKWANEIELASDTKKMETLRKEREEFRLRIDGLIESKFQIASSLGTIYPEELRSQLSLRLSDLEGQLAELNGEINLLAWELESLPAPQTQPTGEDGSQVDESGSDRIYSRDAEWRELDRRLSDAEFRRDTSNIGPAHPRYARMEAEIAHMRGLRAQREEQLDLDWRQAAMGGTASLPEGVTPYKVIDHLKRKKGKQAEWLTEQVARQSAKVAEAGKIAQQIAQYDEDIAQRRERLEQVKRRLEVLEVEGKAAGRVEVESYAISNSRPHKDRRPVFTAMAVCGAFALALGVGYIRSAFDRRIYGASDVQYMYHVPFLGLLPMVPDRSRPREIGGQAADLAMIRKGSAAHELGTYTRHALMESMRMVRTALLERLSQTGEQTILITSALPSTGKTSVALLLAKSLAVVGKRVLLVEGDLRRPALSVRLGLKPESGLAALLNGEANESQTIIPSGTTNLDVLLAGEVPEDFDPELLANGVFAGCVERWKEHYDYILLDSPPVLPVADAQVLASLADGTLMVMRASHDRREEASDAYAQLNSAGGRLLGTVLIGGQAGQEGGGEYGHYYRYYRSYGATSGNGSAKG